MDRGPHPGHMPLMDRGPRPGHMPPPSAGADGSTGLEVAREEVAREPVDADQRRAARERLDICLCVEAAAGTGKTTLLLDRVSALLAAGVRPSEIAAITFTELAAAELKRRLRERFEAQDPARALELEAAQISTIHSLALTILRERPIEAGLHPGFETLDPARAEELFDELWREWLKSEVPDGDTLAPTPGAAHLRLALGLGLDTGSLREAARSLYEYRDVVLQARRASPALGAGLAGRLRALGERLQRELAQPGGVLDTRGVRQGDAMAEAIRRLRELTEDGSDSLCPPDGDPGLQGVAGLAEVRRRARAWLEAPGLSREPGRMGSQANWPSRERLEAARRTLAELRGELAELEAEASRSAAGALVAWLAGFVDWAQEEKRRRGCIDFLDQLLLCRNLLRDFPAVRRHFQSRWRYVLVDEFQDTDPLQAEIVFFLAEELPGWELAHEPAGAEAPAAPRGAQPGQPPGARGPSSAACGGASGKAGGQGVGRGWNGPATRWEDVRLGPGRLFVVGDPKQSIYRFRRADVEMYEEAARRLAVQGQRLTIRQNFRCCPAIARWVNQVFSRLMVPSGEDGGGGAAVAFQPAYVPIEPWRPDPDRGGWPPEVVAPGVYRLEPEGVDPEAGVAQRREAEARWVAGAIRELVGGGRLRVWAGNPGTYRPASYGDVAVLMPAFTELEVYEEALRGLGVPFRVAGGRQFFLRSEVRELSALLSAVVDPTDTMAVVASLRSGFFGVGDDELLRWAQAGRSFDPLALDVGPARVERGETAGADGVQGTQGAPDGGGREQAWGVAAGLAEIRRWHEQLAGVPPRQAVRRLLDETGYRALAAARRGGEQALANLAKVEAHAAAMEAQGASLHAFARWLRRRGPGGPAAAEEEDAPLAEAGDDVVRIMTVHKAKGLEFPVVFVVNLFGERSWNEPVVVDRRTGRVELRLGRRELGLQTEGFEDAAAAERARGEAERLRLYYVAMTRARDYLIIGAAGRGQGFWELVARSGLGPHAEPPRLSVAAPARPEEGGEPAAGGLADGLAELRERWLRSRAALLARASQGLRVEAARLGPGGEEAFGAGADAAGAAPERLTEGASSEGAADGDGTRVGQAFHAVMERAGQRRLEVDEEWVGRQVDAVAWALGLAPAESEQVREWVARACRPDSELRRWAAQAEGWWVEVPLAYAEEGGERIREGRVDLLWREAGGRLRAVDYKTDDVPPEELVRRYRPQAQAYAEGLARAAACAPQALQQPGADVQVYLYCVRHGSLVLAARRDAGAGRGACAGGM